MSHLTDEEIQKWLEAAENEDELTPDEIVRQATNDRSN